MTEAYATCAGQRRARRRRFVALLVVAAGVTASGIAGETASTTSATPAESSAKSVEKSPVESGRAVGELVPQFFSRVVTGSLMNRSVCFVCRYGERPVVMVLMRKIGPNVRPLLKNIDRIVEQHRAGGLRSFGVLVSDQSFPAISAVQTFSFNNHVAMPLTVGTEAVAADSCQNLSPDAAVTVIFYRKRLVVEKFTFRADELEVERFTPVIESLKKFAAQHSAGQAAPMAEDAETAE